MVESIDSSYLFMLFIRSLRVKNHHLISAELQWKFENPDDFSRSVSKAFRMKSGKAFPLYTSFFVASPGYKKTTSSIPCVLYLYLIHSGVVLAIGQVDLKKTNCSEVFSKIKVSLYDILSGRLYGIATCFIASQRRWIQTEGTDSFTFITQASRFIYSDSDSQAQYLLKATEALLESLPNSLRLGVDLVLNPTNDALYSKGKETVGVNCSGRDAKSSERFTNTSAIHEKRLKNSGDKISGKSVSQRIKGSKMKGIFYKVASMSNSRKKVTKRHKNFPYSVAVNLACSACSAASTTTNAELKGQKSANNDLKLAPEMHGYKGSAASPVQEGSSMPVDGEKEENILCRLLNIKTHSDRNENDECKAETSNKFNASSAMDAGSSVDASQAAIATAPAKICCVQSKGSDTAVKLSSNLNQDHTRESIEHEDVTVNSQKIEQQVKGRVKCKTLNHGYHREMKAEASQKLLLECEMGRTAQLHKNLLDSTQELLVSTSLSAASNGRALCVRTLKSEEDAALKREFWGTLTVEPVFDVENMNKDSVFIHDSLSHSSDYSANDEYFSQPVVTTPNLIDCQLQVQSSSSGSSLRNFVISAGSRNGSTDNLQQAKDSSRQCDDLGLKKTCCDSPIGQQASQQEMACDVVLDSMITSKLPKYNENFNLDCWNANTLNINLKFESVGPEVGIERNLKTNSNNERQNKEFLSAPAEYSQQLKDGNLSEVHAEGSASDCSRKIDCDFDGSSTCFPAKLAFVDNLALAPKYIPQEVVGSCTKFAGPINATSNVPSDKLGNSSMQESKIDVQIQRLKEKLNERSKLSMLHKDSSLIHRTVTSSCKEASMKCSHNFNNVGFDKKTSQSFNRVMTTEAAVVCEENINIQFVPDLDQLQASNTYPNEIQLKENALTLQSLEITETENKLQDASKILCTNVASDNRIDNRTQEANNFSTLGAPNEFLNNLTSLTISSSKLAHAEHLQVKRSLDKTLENVFQEGYVPKMNIQAESLKDKRTNATSKEFPSDESSLSLEGLTSHEFTAQNNSINLIGSSHQNVVSSDKRNLNRRLKMKKHLRCSKVELSDTDGSNSPMIHSLCGHMDMKSLIKDFQRKMFPLEPNKEVCRKSNDRIEFEAEQDLKNYQSSQTECVKNGISCRPLCGMDHFKIEKSACDSELDITVESNACTKQLKSNKRMQQSYENNGVDTIEKQRNRIKFTIMKPTVAEDCSKSQAESPTATTNNLNTAFDKGIEGTVLNSADSNNMNNEKGSDIGVPCDYTHCKIADKTHFVDGAVKAVGNIPSESTPSRTLHDSLSMLISCFDENAVDHDSNLLCNFSTSQVQKPNDDNSNILEHRIFTVSPSVEINLNELKGTIPVENPDAREEKTAKLDSTMGIVETKASFSVEKSPNLHKIEDIKKSLIHLKTHNQLEDPTFGNFSKMSPIEKEEDESKIIESQRKYIGTLLFNFYEVLERSDQSLIGDIYRAFGSVQCLLSHIFNNICMAADISSKQHLSKQLQPFFEVKQVPRYAEVMTALDLVHLVLSLKLDITLTPLAQEVTQESADESTSPREEFIRRIKILRKKWRRLRSTVC